MNKIFGFIFLSFFVIMLSVYASNISSDNTTKYKEEYFTYFDTYSVFECYAENEDKFKKYSDTVKNELEKYHRYFDIYNEYPQINNIKTINDNAGIKAVEADREILDLIDECKIYYEQTHGAFNIALGSVLSLWHNERAKAMENPDTARLPDMQELKKAAKHISINNIIIDKDNSTVFIADGEASLDLGAIAKGYAAQKTVERLREEGVDSAILNLGGNVYTIGKPRDKEKWVIGVQNTDDDNNIIIADKVYVNDTAVVSSGDYQRYYTVDGKNYHHIIDYKTLMPSEEFKAVTVIYNDSKIADMLSTSLFVMSLDEGRRLAESYGAEAVWYHKNGDIDKTAGFDNYKE